MQTLYIIDASGYLYRSYFAIQNMTNKRGESTNALYGFIRSLLKLFKDFHPTHCIAVFDGPQGGQSRKALFPEYKAHRASTPPDLIYQIEWARQFCALRGIPLLNVAGVEADDTMGAIANWAAEQGARVFLCSGDKDLCQLVNNHISILNTHKDNKISGSLEVEAAFGVFPNQIIDYLAMIGDSSDNIPGVPGLGPKTAASLLKEFGSIDQLLQQLEKLSPKKRELIQQNESLLRLSQKLVTLNTEVPFPKESTFFQLTSPKLEELNAFYQEMDFLSLMRENELKPQSQIPLPSGSYFLIENEERLEQLIDSLRKVPAVCIEVASTDNNPFKAELLGIALAIQPEEAWYIPLNSSSLSKERVIESLQTLTKSDSLAFYGHNIKYDLQLLSRYGVEIKEICFDTSLASYILHAQQRQHSLETLVLQYFGKVKTSIKELLKKEKKSLQELSPQQLYSYTCEDVTDTCRLKAILEEELQQRNLSSLLYQLELPLLFILADMERHGIFLDIPVLEELANGIKQEIFRLEKEIHEMAGEEFNLNSPKQMSAILFDKLGISPPKKTATGLSTSAEVLEELKSQYPICEKILEYRGLEKLRSTYLEALPLEVLSSSQRIHCTFNQSVAATGRLACQDPNLQNIPVRTSMGREIRKAFRPQKENWSFLAADYSQIELRLLAHLSQDPILIEAFCKGEDIHSHTASIIYGIPLNQVSSNMRYSAKAVNFGIVYGQQAFGLARELGIGVKDAALFIDSYFKKYQGVHQFIENCKKRAYETGKTVTYTGRERAIPEIHSKNIQLRLAAERLAINAPIQGSAADLIKQAMLAIHQVIIKENLMGYMVLQIHDELIFEVPDEELSLFKILVKNCMEHVIALNVPLIADISIGKNWKEC